MPQVVLRTDHQTGFLVVVERAQPDQVRAVAFQGDATGLGQALQEDLRFHVVELIIGDAGHVFPPSSKKISIQANVLDNLARGLYCVKHEPRAINH